MVHVNGPFAAVRNKLIYSLNRSVLMALPLPALRSGILVPVSSAQKIRTAIIVHVNDCNPFGMIRAKAMRKKGRLRNVIGSIPPLTVQLGKRNSGKQAESSAA